MNYALLFSLVAHAATPQADSNPSGLAALGLDWRALLFQILNFALLLWLLKRFAYRPIIQTLLDRRQKIEEGLTTAESMAAERARLAGQKQAILAQAKTEAAALLQANQQQARALIEEAQRQAHAQQQQTLAATELKIAHSMTQARRALQHEMISLVTQAVEQIIDLKLDGDQDQKLVRSRINRLLAQRP